MSITDRPKSLGVKEALESRLAQVDEPHVRPLTNYVAKLRRQFGPAAAIPNFDPWDGGVEAEILYLLEAPGPKAKTSSFVSRNNPDETAKNLFELSVEAGVNRNRTVIWNVVPWYIGSESKIRPARASDIGAGFESLKGLLAMLPKLRVAILFGRKAEKAKQLLCDLDRELHVIACPHPSPLVVNRRPENRQKIIEGLIAARSSLEKQ